MSIEPRVEGTPPSDPRAGGLLLDSTPDGVYFSGGGQYEFHT
jgi:hypothetical protein